MTLELLDAPSRNAEIVQLQEITLDHLHELPEYLAVGPDGGAGCFIS